MWRVVVVYTKELLPELRVHIKESNNSPRGKFHRFLFPFSSKFPHLNFAPYVLYIYSCYETRTWHKQWAWVACGLISPKRLLDLNNFVSMNVTFSSNVLSRWAQLINIFSRMFNLRTLMCIAKSRRSGLELGDLLILFNRSNCSLSVGGFSFSLICESIAAQFFTFVHHGEQTLVELRNILLPRGQRKVRFQ